MLYLIIPLENHSTPPPASSHFIPLKENIQKYDSRVIIISMLIIYVRVHVRTTSQVYF